MNQDDKQAVALFRLAAPGHLIHADLEPGDQKRLLLERAKRTWTLPMAQRASTPGERSKPDSTPTAATDSTG